MKFRRKKISRTGVNDVLELSTGESLETHAEKATKEARVLSSKAGAEERNANIALEKARAEKKAAVVIRKNSTKRLNSVLDVLENVRD